MTDPRETLSLKNTASAQNRTPRDSVTRDTAQHEEVWTPPNVLPDPEPRDGFVFRWVATDVMGHEIRSHTSLRLREGWEPVRAEEHPEFLTMLDKGAKDGTIRIGGLLLCKMPEAKAKARAAYYRNQSKEQIRGVDKSYMRESDPRMPLSAPEKRSQVILGGSKIGTPDS